MKKIIGTLLLGAMTVGFAFAADPDITMNYRSRMDFFYGKFKTVETNTSKTAKTIDKTKTLTWLDQDGYAGPEDAFGFKANAENFGVQIQFNANATAAGLAKLNTYNGWMKFGDLKLSAGVWRDGYLDGSYRVKKDVDAACLEGAEFEAIKLGSLFKGVGNTFIDDMGSTGYSGGPILDFFAEYPIKAGDKTTINILAGLVTKKVDSWDNGTGDTEKDGNTTTTTKNSWSIESAPVARIQINVKNVLNTEVIWKNTEFKKHAWGLYFMPKMVKGLDLNIGGSVSVAPRNTWDDMKKGTKYTSVRDKDIGLETWGVDLRLRYEINKKLSITSFHNLSGLGNVYKTLSRYQDKNGKWQEFTHYGENTPTLGRTFGGGSGANNVMAMWNNIALRYKVNDTVAVGFTAGFITGLKAKEGTTKNSNGELEVDEHKAAYKTNFMYDITPYVQIYAASNAFITIGVSLQGSKLVKETANFGTTKEPEYKDDVTKEFDVRIPVVFRIKM